MGHKKSIVWKVVLIGIIVMAATAGFAMVFGTHTFRREITRLHRQDYAERIRNIEFEYELVDAVSMATEHVEEEQARLLDHLMERYIRDAGLAAYPFIVNGDGDVILHLERSPVDRAFYRSGAGERIFSERSGEIEVSHGGGRHWVLFSYFEPWDWITGFVMENSVRFAALYSFSVRMALGLLLALVILVVLYVVYLRRLLNPLGAVPVVMNRLLDGDLYARLSVDSSDEAGRIAEAFNTFADEFGRIVASSRKSYPQAQPRNGNEGQDFAQVQHRRWLAGS